jgi:hypothetical protein
MGSTDYTDFTDGLVLGRDASAIQAGAAVPLQFVVVVGATDCHQAVELDVRYVRNFGSD